MLCSVFPPTDITDKSKSSKHRVISSLTDMYLSPDRQLLLLTHSLKLNSAKKVCHFYLTFCVSTRPHMTNSDIPLVSFTRVLWLIRHMSDSPGNSSKLVKSLYLPLPLITLNKNTPGSKVNVNVNVSSESWRICFLDVRKWLLFW